MRYLVPDDAMNHRAYLFHCVAAHLDWKSVNADFVWQDEAIIMGALRLWDALVEAQQVRWSPPPCPLHRLLIRPVFHYHFDVIEFFPEEIGKSIQCLGYETFEYVPVHGALSCSCDQSGDLVPIGETDLPLDQVGPICL